MAEAAKAEDEQVMYEEGVEGYEDMIPMEGAESLGGEQSVEVSWPMRRCVVVGGCIGSSVAMQPGNAHGSLARGVVSLRRGCVHAHV